MPRRRLPAGRDGDGSRASSLASVVFPDPGTPVMMVTLPDAWLTPER